MKAFGIFTKIINAGINIVTLADGRTYTAATTDLGELVLSIAIMSRAHDEFRTKSYRSVAAWANKRKHADERRLTAKCPGWLKPSADKKSFLIIDERAAVVRSIFEDCIAGIGDYSICRRLYKAGIAPFGRSDGWQRAYITQILNNRAVLGEFQPRRIVAGKRRPEGEPKRNYFPPIIDEDLFFRAQSARRLRRIGSGGRKGTYVSNLFAKVAKCAYCGASMRFINKGSKSNRLVYLICSRAARGFGCEKAGWRYDQFETSFLAFVQELDLQSLVRNEDETKKRTVLENAVAALHGQIADLEQQNNRAYDLFVANDSGPGREIVAKKLDERERQRKQLEIILREKETELAALNSEPGFVESNLQIKNFIEQLQNPGTNELYRLRSQIAAKLQSLVSTILIAPSGIAPIARLHTPYVENSDKVEEGELPRDAIEDITLDLKDHLIRNTAEGIFPDERFFAVIFKNELVRVVFPEDHDPMKFRVQIHETLIHAPKEGQVGVSLARVI